MIDRMGTYDEFLENVNEDQLKNIKIMRNKDKSTYRKIEFRRKESFYLLVRGLEVGIVSRPYCRIIQIFTFPCGKLLDENNFVCKR